MKTFGKIMFVIITLLLSVIAKGFAILKLWNWFVATTFHITTLSLVQAIGISFLVSFLTLRYERSTEAEEFWIGYAKQLAYTFLGAGIALLSGWILLLFI